MRTFLYSMDESDSPDTGILSLTGVLVPTDQYQAICAEIYDFFARRIPGPENAVHTRPPELHGSAMLRDCDWATDDERVGAFELIAGLVNTLGLRVNRVGYTRTSVGLFLCGDPKLLVLNYYNLWSMAGDDLRDAFVVPVMDGLDQKAADMLSAHGRSVTSMLARGLADWVSLPFPERFCEPFFASSRHSPLIQVADVVSYMLHTLDHREQPPSSFRARVQEVARSLDPTLIRNEVVEMRERTSGE